jgi:hypothetical protein
MPLPKSQGVAGVFEGFDLRAGGKILHSPAMKLALAVLVYLIIASILGAGILIAVAGNPWFLVIAFIAFVVAFGKLGCMPH